MTPASAAAFAKRLIPSPVQIEALLTHRAAQSAATVAALLALAWSLSQGTWSLLAPSPPALARSGSGLADLGALTSSHPFGRAAPAGPAPAETRVAVSNLAMTVTGVAMRASGGCALVVVQGQPESAFCAGEEISPGVRLDSVQGDRIVVIRGGAREAVLMKDAAAAPGVGAAPVQTAPMQALVQPGSGADQRVVDRRALQQQLSRPEFLGQATIVPNAGGGFLVRELQPGSIYEKLGLRAGDVIRTVNGQSVSSMDDVMRLYQQFGSAERVQVEVQRGGRSESLYYDMR
jgi:general secretion pathway protein C